MIDFKSNSAIQGTQLFSFEPQLSASIISIGVYIVEFLLRVNLKLDTGVGEAANWAIVSGVKQFGEYSHTKGKRGEDIN